MGRGKQQSAMRKVRREMAKDQKKQVKDYVDKQKPIYIITGTVRSGMTAVARMLHRGGLSVHFNDGKWMESNILFALIADKAKGDIKIDPLTVLENARGMAVKIPSANNIQWPPHTKLIFIFLFRHPIQTAESMLKLMKAEIPGFYRDDEGERKAVEELSLAQEALRRFCLARSYEGKPIQMSFENLIEHPEETADFLIERIKEYSPEIVMDKAAMVDEIEDRPPECMEGFLTFKSILEEE